MLNGHRSLPSGTCLIAELSKALPPGPLRADVNLVLPTQRLCLYLSRELALLDHGTAFLPRLWTWDRFLSEIIVEHHKESLVMVSSQCELIMEHVLTQRASQSPRPLHTNTRHAHELVHLASELARSGDEHAAKERLKQYLADDWRRQGEAYEQLKQRVDDVFNALEDYKQTLSKFQWTTKETSRSQAVYNWVEAAPDRKLASLPPGKILIAGLTSLPPVESKCLRSLAALDPVSVWLDEPTPTSLTSPLADLRQSIGLKASSESQASWAKGVRKITGCTDITHEVTYVLKSVQRLIDEGMPAHDIAVIVPDEETYGPALSALSSSLNVPINMPLATSWSQSQVGRWFRLVTSLGRGNEIHGFAQYILSPITKSLFNAPTGFDDSTFQRELKNLPAFGRFGDDIIRHFERRIDAASANYIKEAVHWCFRSPDSDIEAASQRLLNTVASLMKALSTGDSSTQEEPWSETFDKAVKQVVQLDVIRQYTSADWSKFLANVYRMASQESMRDKGEPLSGLQVIGLTEARYIPFSAVFILGCTEGSFPQGLPRDSLIDNQMRRAMGLPAWKDLESLEDTTFHLLTSRLEAVELTYAQWDAEKPLIRSRWIEMLASKIEPRIIDPGEKAASILCNKEQEPLFDILTPSTNTDCEGKVQDAGHLISSMSASRLRHLIWCPYRYLLHCRRLESIELPQDRSHLSTGNLLHKVLELFFAKEDPPDLEPRLQWRHHPKLASAFGAWAHERLDAIARSITPEDLSRTAQFQHMNGSGWQTIANYWQVLFEKGWDPNLVTTEVEFGKSNKLALMIDDMEIELHGSIDVLHRSPEAGPLIIDYKTSTVPKTRMVAEGLEPQLPLYAKALSMTGLGGSTSSVQPAIDVMTAGYLNLTEGKPTFVAIGETAKNDLISKGLLSKRNKPASLVDAFAAVERRWASRLREIKSTQTFVADPSDCSTCSFAGVCRRDDPRYRERIARQDTVLESLVDVADDAKESDFEVSP